MTRNLLPRLIVIVLIAAMAITADVLPRTTIPNPFNPESPWVLDLKLGLDLQGGLQVLMEADVPEGQAVPLADMEMARSI